MGWVYEPLVCRFKGDWVRVDAKMVFPISVLSFDFSGWMVCFFLVYLFIYFPFFFRTKSKMFCSIIGSLAGTSYWGPVAGHGLLAHELELIRDQRKQIQSQGAGRSAIVKGGDAEVVLAEEGDDTYVKIHKKSKESGNEGEEVN